jgi:SAM-dependent methyltransferase
LEEEKCCVVSCENPLNQEYWDTQYKVKATGWDIGSVSGPIKTIVDALENKNSSILIPGCGNSYEAEYLLKQGFTNVTVIDIAPTLVAAISEKFADNENIKVVLGDFFELEGKYDLIIEQTFFCALPPTMRQKYVWKMHQLLAENGKIEGVLFNRDFDVSPPFGGNKAEYEQLFAAAFDLVKLELCQNSIEKRTNSELVIDFQKNTKVLVNLYAFEGITCSGCMSTVSNKFMEIEGVENVSMSSNFAEVLIVSTKEIPLNLLQEIVSYDEKYKITKII